MVAWRYGISLLVFAALIHETSSWALEVKFHTSPRWREKVWRSFPKEIMWWLGHPYANDNRNTKETLNPRICAKWRHCIISYFMFDSKNPIKKHHLHEVFSPINSRIQFAFHHTHDLFLLPNALSVYRRSSINNDKHFLSVSKIQLGASSLLIGKATSKPNCNQSNQNINLWWDGKSLRTFRLKT